MSFMIPTIIHYKEYKPSIHGHGYQTGRLTRITTVLPGHPQFVAPATHINLAYGAAIPRMKIGGRIVENVVKVGRSSQLPKRLRDLAIEYDVNVVRGISVWHGGDAERILHGILRNYHLVGELFAVPVKAIMRLRNPWNDPRRVFTMNELTRILDVDSVKRILRACNVTPITYMVRGQRVPGVTLSQIARLGLDIASRQRLHIMRTKYSRDINKHFRVIGKG
jgi:hypothetical protein